ncbi:alpha/beta hydrolase fold domain-containing protein [Mycolicibacterium flavescens]|uniref:Alpha/beta hydrolase fold-3 domain-containing protein n=1 Tax=Mycolicibacterium flavescens TaxID=1776 RepID=A0A1E3RRM4_MYCFV|nr:alpha/beta hydrolase [Mycolicibacterium flavescens]MCV7279946.1 alpha/beta hydrolase fold domain-containing protein [Mycolicibacterium flavescens]ODQ92555.1 hypothetical protein BHQ18_02200 [Mycolicibacterium flavescens]
MDRAVTYVGRIGVLAVALGVGAAALNGGGIAWAQTEDAAADSPASAPASSPEQQSGDEPAEPSTPDPEPDEADDVRSAPVGVVVSTGGAQHDEDDREEDAEEEEVDDEPEEPPASKRADQNPVDNTETADDFTRAEPVAPAASTEEPAPAVVEIAEPAAEPVVQQPDPPAPSQDTVALKDEPDPAPVSTTATLLSTVLTTVLAPLADGPAQPAPPPIPLALMAFARREVEDALLANAPVVESVSTPMAAAAVTEPVFTGRPSLVTQIFVAGLRLIKPVLDLFGIELNGTSARIPFFTDGIPPFFVTLGLKVTSSEYEGWKVWTLAPTQPTEKVVVALHGGSFISTASLFHWWTYADMARNTGATVVVPLYPLANSQGTGGTAKTVVPTVADFIAAQVDTHGRENVSVIGDSAGGAIALAAAQELVRRCDGDEACLTATLPGRLVLLSPVLDTSMTNPAIADVDDPLLSPASSRRNGQWWARGLETPEDPDGTKHPLASPIYGSLADLPPIAVYAGSLDLRTPDVLVLQQKAAATPGADFTFELRRGQIHDWTIFPFLPDAHAERPKIYADLGLEV